MRTLSVAVILLLVSSPALRSQETLRITPFVNDNHVVVSFELNDAYTDAVREAIASGLRTTFTYELELRTPVARTADAWLAFGFDEDLDLAAEHATATMLDLMERELQVERDHALALASVAVDLHVTQIVNGVKGVHAVLADGAIR